LWCVACLYVCVCVCVCVVSRKKSNDMTEVSRSDVDCMPPCFYYFPLFNDTQMYLGKQKAATRPYTPHHWTKLILLTRTKHIHGTNI
jgi:hypothetical protein